jgi:hypothetical protein
MIFCVLLCPARRASLGDGSASPGVKGVGVGPQVLLAALVLF